MANKKPKDGHISLNSQQVAFMHQVIESEDKHRQKFSKSPPRRKRNPILGEPTPRSTAREADVAQLKQAQLDHTRKQLAMTPTVAGRRRAAERKAAADAIQNIPTSTEVPSSANGAIQNMVSGLSGMSARSNMSARMVSARVASGTLSSSRQSARQSAQPSARLSARPSARPTGRSTSTEIYGGEEAKNVVQMRARKAWLERQLREVEDSLQSIPEN